ncbi:MAG: AraC family transcriptional regulator [Flavobacterium sp.]|uniref:helix-turn-helix domain-containing protein n=1 Tax=Flavobacterium sp. TaxID=239 RepID=UPI0026366558|nr:AraC family transcriptional regulator [Flavobacterium sp.]MDD5152110.1 AraC family transcriptional regulator [Flavobacterium sp.]
MTFEIKTLKYKGKVVFEKAVMSTNFKRIPKFFQENEACFLFLTKGAFQYRTPTNVLSFTEGDAMLSKCGNYFIEQLATNPNPKTETLTVIGSYFYPEIIKHFFETDLSIQNFQNNFDTVKINVEPLMKSYIESIFFLLDNPEIADENLIVNKLKELLLLLSKTEKAASINEFISSLFIPFEYNFNEIIQQNLYANLSLKEYATLCNCSLSTFKRKFFDLYSESPSKYILIKKLEKTTQLLQIKTKPIADIAYDCGFETVSSFNKGFKKHFSKSPSEYRLNFLENNLNFLEN